MSPALAQYLLTRGLQQAHAPRRNLLQPNKTIFLSRHQPKPCSIHPVTGLFIDYSSSGVRPRADLNAMSPGKDIFWDLFQPGLQSYLNKAYLGIQQ